MKKLSWIRGDTCDLRVIVKDKTTNTVIQSAGEVFLTIKTNLEDSDDIAIFKSKVELVNGVADFTVSPAESDLFPIGEFYYDVQIKFANGSIKSIKVDKMRIDPDVTRRTS